MPRISVPGLFDPVFPQAVHVPNRDDRSAQPACCAASARLKDALDNLPRHAKRLARWKAKGELALKAEIQKPGRLSPFRPGLAPGKHRHEEREIDADSRRLPLFCKEGLG